VIICDAVSSFIITPILPYMFHCVYIYHRLACRSMTF